MTFQTGAPPRPVALIQLCFKDPRLPSDAQYTCFLLHVCRCPAGLPAPLTALLANPAIAKVGVGIYQDAHKLKNDFVVEMGGLIELSDHANARLADPAAGKLPQRWSRSPHRALARAPHDKKPICALQQLGTAPLVHRTAQLRSNRRLGESAALGGAREAAGNVGRRSARGSTPCRSEDAIRASDPAARAP